MPKEADNSNGTKIFAGQVYTATCKKTSEEIQMFDVFAGDEVSLHIFMASFIKDRKYFRYDTFFPHYALPVEYRTQMIEAGAIETDRDGEKQFIHDWHIKAVDNRFL